MKITCLMPTYNRFPHDRWMVDEAVECFLRQDYPDRELLILNDCVRQKIVCDAPGVRVVNYPHRFPTLSDKIQSGIDHASGDALCRWDDDDLSLPWRLSLSAAGLEGKLEWRAENYWWENYGQPWKHVVGPGNTHTMSVFTHECLEKIGGYPQKRSGDEDQEFNKALRLAMVNGRGVVLKPEDVFYVYRWGLGRHLSAGGSGDGLQKQWDDIGKRKVLPGVYRVDPHWRRDYVSEAGRAAESARRTTAVS